MPGFTDAELISFLDEQLGPERSSALEEAVRADATLRQRLIELRGRSMAGVHTIGAIWRREQLSCPDRDELQKFMMGTNSKEEADYISFHLREIGCRICNANIDDLHQQLTAVKETDARRTRFFQTSAGHLRDTDNRNQDSSRK